MRIGGERGETETLVMAIREEVEEEVGVVKGGFSQSLVELLTVPGNRRALIIACMLQGLQQLCGFVSFDLCHPVHIAY